MSFEQLISSIERAETKGIVDPSITDILDTITSETSELGRKWVEDRKAHPDVAFAWYRVIRNVELVMLEMKERILSSKAEGSNPIVLQDALKVAPLAQSLFEQAKQSLGRTLHPRIAHSIHSRTRLLRSVAAEVRMLPSFKKEMQDTDKGRLKAHVVEIYHEMAKAWQV